MENVEKEPLWTAKSKKLLTNPLGMDNPITVQVLGICSALAVTVKMKPAIVMAISVTVVLALSNLIIALMRKSIPGRIRIIVQLVVIATLVIMVDQFLKAFAFDVSKQLSVFVGLIITNCIIMGRLEAFAMANKPWPSLLDGIGNGAGYGLILIIVSFFREFLGSGSIMGYPVMEKLGVYKFGYEDNGMMILPPMALITVGLIIWFQRARNKSLIENK
ncbi:MAG: NADH:ubiquinone reductase (Na(+)-transporting) subunit D [Bacteroidales bacterium]|jgi:Na+-transporting NADH:ubiquinone oxidoreductase subunit D|nr:NADH:ubiquinone reductase (Na(+)-transporting) subunit D [Bacteroidales bacterium]